MMGPIRILLLEDDSGDAALLERFLRRAGLDVVIRRIELQTELSECLKLRDWDLVLSDFHLTGMTAFEALAEVRRCQSDLPFIVVSGLIGEERAVDLMRAGARDFVVKDRLARLVPAIERELYETRRHREREQLAARVREHENMLVDVVRSFGDGLWEWNPQTRQMLCSDDWHRILGYPAASFNGDAASWYAIIHPDDIDRYMQAERDYFAGSLARYRCEVRMRCGDGSWKWILDRGFIVERDARGQPVREVGTITDISAFRELQEQSARSEALLGKLAREVPGMLYQIQLHPDGRLSFPYVSHGIRAMYDFAPEDVRDNAVVLFSRVHPDDLSDMLLSVHQSARDLSPWSHRHRIHLPGRALRWVHGEASPERLADGSVVWHGFIRDVTEQVAAEAELRLLHACAHQANDGILITEAEPLDVPGPRIVFANRAFELQTGYRAAEIIGQNPRLLQGVATDRSELASLGARLRNWEMVRIELLNYRKSGEPFWVELQISPVPDSTGRYAHWISIQRDITQRKRIEAERERLIGALETRNAELDAYNHSVAHDLRNPIISIRGLTDLAELSLEGNERMRAIGYLRKIARCAELADSLIKSLLALAKLGRQAMELRELQLRTWLELLLGEMEFLLDEQRGEVAIADIEIETLVADEALLRIMLSNLISNALKHRPESRRAQIRIEALQTVEPCGVSLRVHDNGNGIAREYQQRMFQLFERLDAQTDGAGVGLVLVERAARLHQGWARLLDSEPGVGSCFEVWLPIVSPPPA